MLPIQELISAEKIADRVRWIGDAVRQDYQTEPLTIVSVLKGSFVFASDVFRSIRRHDAAIDFLGTSSYADGTETTGVVRITHDLSKPVEGRHVLLVEDIVDTGLTLQFLLENMKARNPASVKVCALLHKPARQRVPVKIDYLGFTIEDHFVVGYGLDYAEQYRALPYVGVLEP
jgi:hypoxanthine phosphoribosyltransferase